ncbi:alpha/beta-hydrolase [Aspergillus steynii IBT 23096]|uniref:Alpha/beta-hydrolase n=1 Tax=Aspergillus steynii IBT 23096 TaxID=1392250 RepID=A0A2I2FW50_9EURO|nr:alpha/beta-hydrolase [Aspergillus steynii IBT 23096]PLB44862.1 alpha/beta-hydrolase [Aspergillus steynii IBT 23096]
MASPESKATILLIHGGWHTPSHYSAFTTYLESHGHEVHIPRLSTTNGARPPTADLSTDTAQIRTYATDLISAGHRLVVIMHSYGGQVGTNALSGLSLKTRAQQNLPGGVARLVYVTAFALSPGNSMLGMVREMGDEALIPVAFAFDEDGVVWDRDPKNLLVGPGLGDEEMERFVGSLVVWNGRAMEQGISGCAWREDVGVSYVCTRGDMTVPERYQRTMIERMREVGKEVEVFELETGHCPQVTMPRELGEVVCGIVRREEGRWV